MPFSRTLTRVTRGRMNRLMLRFAGHAAFADLEHVGRRSGVIRHTPVRAFLVGDTVVVGLNFGPRSDWFKNITRAGGCRMRLGRERLSLGAPRVVPAEQVLGDIPALFRFGLRHLARTEQCVVLPVVARRPIAPVRVTGSRPSSWPAPGRR